MSFANHLSRQLRLVNKNAIFFAKCPKPPICKNSQPQNKTTIYGIYSKAAIVVYNNGGTLFTIVKYTATAPPYSSK